MHILPGRLRVRFAQIKNRPILAERFRLLLQQEQGISKVTVNPATGSCLVLFDANLSSQAILERILRQIKNATNYTLAAPTTPSTQRENKLPRVMTGGAILTLFLGLPGVGNTMSLPLTSAALVTTGYPIFKRGLAYWGKHKKPNYDLMISILSVVAALQGNGTFGLFALWLSYLSEYLQHLTFKTASRSFSNILIKKGNRLALVRENKVTYVLPGDVMPGDLVLFRAGDCLPVEGKVVSGQALGNPGEKFGPGTWVEAGTILEKGRILVKVHRVVEDTSLARLADILDDAMENPQKGSALAVHYAERMLPITALTTLLVFGLTRDFQRTLPVLLAGAPGPAGLAAPTALSASTGLAAGMGIAIQNCSALERLSHMDVILFQDKSLPLKQGDLHPALHKLQEEGFAIEDFDPREIEEPANSQLEVSSPAATVAKLQRKGLRVAWVSGPDQPLLVENADINIMFLSGEEREIAPAQVLCYRKDPRQVYRLMRLSQKTMHTIRENVYMVQSLNIIGQVLGAMGLISCVPAIGLNLLTTLAVVFHSGHSLIGIGNKNYSPFHTKGTIEGLSVDKGKCLLLSKRNANT